jgi:hypothetical protein
MSEKLLRLRKRVRKIERALANSAWRQRLAHCNCRAMTVADDPAKFEEEMNLPCPAHGFLQLGRIIHVVKIGSSENSGRLDELIATYETRARRARFALKDDDFEEL